MSSPDIPSSVSAAQLAAVLSERGQLPPVAALPALSFGGGESGLCDLQLALLLLVDKAENPPSLVQELTTAMWLLHRCQSQIDGRFSEAIEGSGAFTELSASSKQRVLEEMRAMSELIKEINGSLWALHVGIAIPMVERRMRAAAGDRWSQLGPDEMRALRGQVLISDQLIESLELDRDVVDGFLAFHSEADPNTTAQ